MRSLALFALMICASPALADAGPPLPDPGASPPAPASELVPAEASSPVALELIEIALAEHASPAPLDFTAFELAERYSAPPAIRYGGASCAEALEVADGPPLPEPAAPLPSRFSSSPDLVLILPSGPELNAPSFALLEPRPSDAFELVNDSGASRSNGVEGEALVGTRSAA